MKDKGVGKGVFWVCILALLACNKSKIDNYQGYPEEVGEIILTKCATPGCHNDRSRAGAAGLSLASWERLFEGSSNGAVAIPFDHTFSTLFLFSNVYPEFGVTAIPAMPYNAAPLSREEILTLRFWINEGAPSSSGEIKFSQVPLSQKYYVLNRGCDQVAVIDRSTDLIMRYVKVTFGLDVEFVERIELAPDGKHWYAVSPGGKVIQKYRTSDDELVGTLLLGEGDWRNICINPNSASAFVVDASPSGAVCLLDLDQLEVKKVFNEPDWVENAGFPCFNSQQQAIYLTTNSGNFIYKLKMTDPDALTSEKILLSPGSSPTSTSAHNPREVLVYPGGDKYFVSCLGTHEVMVLNAETDEIMGSINIDSPQRMVYSETKDYLFVSSTNDLSTYPGLRGSVSVIDCSTLTKVKTLYSGSQPYAMAIDKNRSRVLVTHRNITEEGPAPHHVTECEGRNGYITAIDLNSLELIPNDKFEVAVDPVDVMLFDSE